MKKYNTYYMNSQRKVLVIKPVSISENSIINGNEIEMKNETDTAK